MTDWIPGISLLKSAVQLICGNPAAAWETQKNFVKKCPIVSHVVGGLIFPIAVLCDDKRARKFAGEAWIGGTKTMSDITDGIPVVGHVKGGIRHLLGDHEGGNKALISASRTTLVIGAGAGGFLIGGPVGAVAGGISSGILFDGMHTVAEGNKNGPQGIWALGQQTKVGDIFDTIVGVESDGLTGFAGGTAYKALRSPEIDAVENIQAKQAEMNLNEPAANLEVLSEVNDLETDKKYFGNKKIQTKTKLTLDNCIARADAMREVLTDPLLSDGFHFENLPDNLSSEYYERDLNIPDTWYSKEHALQTNAK